MSKYYSQWTCPRVSTTPPSKHAQSGVQQKGGSIHRTLFMSWHIQHIQVAYRRNHRVLRNLYSYDCVLTTDTGSTNSFTIYNAFTIMLPNEDHDNTHTASKPPILCANRIEMTQTLLSLAYQRNETAEILHVLPGAHNLLFKIHAEPPSSWYRITQR